jgi:hypothetical protein
MKHGIIRHVVGCNSTHCPQTCTIRSMGENEKSASQQRAQESCACAAVAVQQHKVPYCMHYKDHESETRFGLFAAVCASTRITISVS